MSMSLAALLCDRELPDVAVSGLTEDSRLVNGGDVFIATLGEHSDGHDFVGAAVESGAVAVLSEHPVGDCLVPVVPVPELRKRRSSIAARFHGDPSQAMTCIGVTGTNGKTSVAHEVAELATRIGTSCGFLGTIGWGLPGDLQKSSLTTQGPVVVQQQLATLRDRGAKWVSLEVSSHALDQFRVEAVAFDIGVFTNLTRDHLDYHQTMEAYGAAKRRLFEFPELKTAVINTEDQYGAGLARQFLKAGNLHVLTFGLAEGDVHWEQVKRIERGFSGRLVSPYGSADLKVGLYGRFSLSNLAAAVGCLCAAGLDFKAVAGAIPDLAGVPGRMEFFGTPGGPAVVVDFAHTPDALETVLHALRDHCNGRLICLVGCGGDRDTGKRPMMARAAEKGADVVVLTSDNPRGEDPNAILHDMQAGLREPDAARLIPDRREAVVSTLRSAAAGDLVLLAGKGHEDYQEIATGRVHYSDRELAQAFSVGEIQRGEV
jgi:UDP-N-acetylmuramoyl-L-alanyl-D-glutamate--2,6-diaminopimelate ligase